MSVVPRVSSIRARLTAALLVSAIPIMAMTGLAARQNYLLRSEHANEVAEHIRIDIAARYHAKLTDLQAALANIALLPALLADNPTACATALSAARTILARHGQDGGDLGFSVRDTAGKIRCTAGPQPRTDAPWLSRLAAGLPNLTLVDAVRPGLPMITAVPIMVGGQFAGALAATLDSRKWLVTRGSETFHETWVFASNGVAVPIGGGVAEGALPPETSLRLLAAGPEPVILRALSRNGISHAYAAANLDPGPRLLIGYPASADIENARYLLIRRAIDLGILLLGSLLIVTQLRSALAQQDQLMQEIHHRVKNNLQIVASLLNLQAARIRQPEAKAEFQSARDRVRALATLHRHLYAHGELHTINMRSFLNELCGQLFQAIGEPRGDRIQLDIEAPELQISSDQAVPMALIVTEAVSNAIKYAFPGGRGGHVSVRLTAVAEDAQLVIEDDGVGMPAGQVETESGIRDGIGIQLIRGFARQLGASLTVTEQNGTRYDVRMTLRRQRDIPEQADTEPGGQPPQGPAETPAAG
jgi:two-component sensor histidine kinase